METAQEPQLSPEESIAKRNSLMKELLGLAPRKIIPHDVNASKPVDSKPAARRNISEDRKPPTPEDLQKDIRKIADKIRAKNDTKEDITQVKFFDGISIDVFDYFDLKPAGSTSDQIKRLQMINKWAFNGNIDTTEALKKINKLDIQLGNRDMGETKLSKIYVWVKLHGNF